MTAPTSLRVERTVIDRHGEEDVYKAQQVWLAEDTTRALQAFARQHHLTLNVLLQGAWALLLSRYSAEPDVLFGVTVSGRPVELPGVEGMVGLFINTLPVRVQLPSHAELLPWLHALHARLVELDQYSYCPLTDIQEWSDVPRGQPLFETMVAFENYPMDTPHMAQTDQLRISRVQVEDTTHYPITVIAGPGIELFLKIRYHAGRFKADTIQRMLAHLQVLLQGFVANPRQRLYQLPMLHPGERYQVLEHVNATSLAVPALCLHQMIEAQAARRPEAVAVRMASTHAAGDETEVSPPQITYGTLNARANQLARYLRRLGVGPEVTVGLCTTRSITMVIGMLAVLKAGGAYVPLDPEYPAPRLHFMLADSEARVLLTEAALGSHLPATDVPQVYLDRDWEQIALEARDNLETDVQPANLAYLIYTSGSTGQPKGVTIAHQSVVAFCTWVAQVFPPDTLDGVLASTSICFDLSIFELFATLVWGGQVVLAANALDLTCLRDSHEVTLVNTVPSAMAELVQGQGLPGSVRLVNLAGEPLAQALVRQIYASETVEAVYNLYGPSEYTTYATFARMQQGDEQPPGIGEPVANTSTYVLDREAQPVPLGVPGELYIGGAGLARGYFNRPALTAARFVPDPFSRVPGTRLYRTGDLVRRLAAGHAEQPFAAGPLDFLGRLDHQIKLRGFRIETGEIEAVLEQHPEVERSVVLVQEHTPDHRRLVAYVVRTPADRADLNAVSTPDGGSIPQERLATAAADQLTLWEHLWNDTYYQPPEVAEPTFNTVGWNSSYTGLPIAAAEMRAWLDSTVAHLRAQPLGRVLEIGCGTGMLLFRLAPYCTHYTATDLSSHALAYITRQLASMEALVARVTLRHQAAHDVQDFAADTFDTVILNSVAQYFPSLEYLVAVLASVIRVMAPGGRIFLGDLRSLPLLEALHASVQVQRAPTTMTLGQLRQRVQQSMAQERELVVDPAFFRSCVREFPTVSHVRVELKHGRYHNELTRFRYDVILHVQAETEPEPPLQCLDWQQDSLSLAGLRQALAQQEPLRLLVRGIPNARLTEPVALTARLAAGEDTLPVSTLRGQLPQGGMEPDDFHAVGQELAYGVSVTTSDVGLASFDVLYYRPVAAVIAPTRGAAAGRDKPRRAYANDPLQGERAKQLVPRLRTFLAAKVPDYMLPGAFVMLEAIPLTPNGKIDRQALPAPEATGEVRRQGYCVPRDDLELHLVRLWEQVLDHRPIGIKDHFFEVGGHSILAVRLTALIEEALGRRLALRELLSHATIEQLAAMLRQRPSTHPWSPLIPMQPDGAKPPLFCIHPGGGTIVGYFELAGCLGPDQPVYGLQAMGFEEGQEPHERIEDMAACYIEAIVQHYPRGPYLLASWSAGGRVMYEMAQQMIAMGRTPVLLVFIDCFAPALFPEEIRIVNEEDEAAYIARTWDEDVPLSVEYLRTLSSDARLRYVMQRLEDAGLLLPGLDLDQGRRLLRVKRSTSHIGLNKHLVPLPVPVRTVLFRATPDPDDRVYADPTLGWGELCAGAVVLHWIPGNHRTLLSEPHVRLLADKLLPYLEQVHTHR